MTEQAQRQLLHAKIWKIAENVRGSIDGWDFKQYVLGILFYRFISEQFKDYMGHGNPDMNYEEIDEELITDEIKKDTIKTKGYFIMPDQLFSNIVKTARTNENLNIDLHNALQSIQSSAVGYASEDDIKGLFDDVDTKNNRLGATVAERNTRLANILEGIASIDFGSNFDDNSIDLFGDAYEFLISNYASNAGKSGGEFFTPQNVSKLLANIVMIGKDENNKINKIYDPTCGSGSLLLQAKKQFTEHIIEDGFYGQEINMTTYNLARMNMFLHNINYDKFDIKRGNTLLDPKHGNDKPFDAIVSNPPYSVSWIGADDPTLINDERFAPVGSLAPKAKADYAFIMHSLSYLSPRGKAAIVIFPGILYRGGVELSFRKYLIDNNFIEAIVQLPANLFYGTPISTCIMVLAKNKTENKTLFIDASNEFKKVTNNNIMEETHIEKVLDAIKNKTEEDGFSKLVSNDVISDAKYNLSVSTYVSKEEIPEEVDIDDLNQAIDDNIAKINDLHNDIRNILKEIAN